MTRNERLFKLFRDSKEPNFMKFLQKLEDRVIIDARLLFEEKKRQDEEMKKSLERVNSVGEPKND